MLEDMVGESLRRSDRTRERTEPTAYSKMIWKEVASEASDLFEKWSVNSFTAQRRL